MWKSVFTFIFMEKPASTSKSLHVFTNFGQIFAFVASIARMQSQNSNLQELTQCSICLETYTRPKMLPCQHTFCYSCLFTLAKSQQKITCPQCRKDHIIPGGGIAAFQENLLLNNLLPVVSPHGGFDMCEDCQTNPTVQTCGHCDKTVCVNCFIRHKELQRDAKCKLADLQEAFVELCKDSTQRKAQLVNFAEKMQKEVLNARKIFEMKLANMKLRQNDVEEFMNTSAKVYNDLGAVDAENNNGNTYITKLMESLAECNTTNQFTEFMSKLHDLETILNVAKTGSECFRIDFDGEFSLVRLGKSEVRINTLRHHPQSHPVLASVNESPASTDCSAVKDQLIKEKSSPFVFQQSSVGTAAVKKKDNCIRQNMLPRNVDYAGMKQRWITIVGQGKFARDTVTKLYSPLGNAHHVARNEIYVADYTKSAIMVYSADDGSNGWNLHQFRNAEVPADVAISDNGRFVFVACQKRVVKLSIDGQLIQSVASFPGGEFKRCRSVVVHRDLVLALDWQAELIVVFNDKLEYVQAFGENLQAPRALAVSLHGDVYVTDNDGTRVTVFSLEGEGLFTFASDGDLDAAGFVVDGDGFVCVARHSLNCIDVYSPTSFNLVTSIGCSGRFPGGLNHPTRLSLTPQGRLVVSDRDNHRVQIF